MGKLRVNGEMEEEYQQINNQGLFQPIARAAGRCVALPRRHLFISVFFFRLIICLVSFSVDFVTSSTRDLTVDASRENTLCKLRYL